MNNNQKTVTINASFNHKNATIAISLNLSLAHLKQMIFSHFQIDTMHYSLFYKNIRIALSDQRPCYTILGKEKNPRFYIIKKENKSNDNQIKGKDYQTNGKESGYKIIYHKTPSDSRNSNIVHKNIHFLIKNKSNNVTHNVKNRNSLPTIQSKKQLIEPSGVVNKKNYSFNNKPVEYDSSAYLSLEERRIKEAYEDKKNWIDKKGFFRSVGTYSMKPLYIPNYVNITPSEPPANHHFREIKKKQWINQKGFFLA